MRGALAVLGLLAAAAPVRAGLSFVQVSQAQTGRGAAGLFGKSWVEVSGRRMRVVSGYARKILSGAKTPDPERVIQIIDLDKKERLVLVPERRVYRRLPLTEVGYGESLGGSLERDPDLWTLAVRAVRRGKAEHSRVLLGADCEHHRVTAELELSAPEGRVRRARLVQDVWVAPVSGELSASVLDLVAFENAYRKAAGAGLSPLDYERYQVREAALHLGAAPRELMKAVERVREELRGLPGYPVASSVAWSRLDPSTPAVRVPPQREPPARPDAGRLLPVPSLYPGSVGAPFSPQDWGDSERRINRMYGRTRRYFYPFRQDEEVRRSKTRWRMLRLRSAMPLTRRSETSEPLLYPRFLDDMRRTVTLLHGPPAPSAPAAALPSGGAAPFYEVYAELSALETSVKIDAADLQVPAGYAELSGPNP